MRFSCKIPEQNIVSTRFALMSLFSCSYHRELPVSARPLLLADHELDGAVGFQIFAHPHPNPCILRIGQGMRLL